MNHSIPRLTAKTAGRLFERPWSASSGRLEPAENPHQSVPARPPSTPACRKCGTDAYLNFDGFIPACYAADRRGLRPSAVNYTCGHCCEYYSHEAPENWAPPGREWYA